MSISDFRFRMAWSAVFCLCSLYFIKRRGERERDDEQPTGLANLVDGELRPHLFIQPGWFIQSTVGWMDGVINEK